MFFDECATLESCKIQYEKLSKLFDPNRGGDNELMVKLDQEYEKIKSILSAREKEANDEHELIIIFHEILAYAEETEKINPEFTSIVFRKYLQTGKLTLGQFRALMNIYSKFKIKEYFENKKSSEPDQIPNQK